MGQLEELEEPSNRAFWPKMRGAKNSEIGPKKVEIEPQKRKNENEKEVATN